MSGSHVLNIYAALIYRIHQLLFRLGITRFDMSFSSMQKPLFRRVYIQGYSSLIQTCLSLYEVFLSEISCKIVYIDFLYEILLLFFKIFPREITCTYQLHLSPAWDPLTSLQNISPRDHIFLSLLIYLLRKILQILFGLFSSRGSIYLPCT